MFIALLSLTVQLAADPELDRPAPAETLHVEVSGEGAPVVIVPGLLGGGFGFRRLVPLFDEAGYRTVVIDLLGTGRSSRPRHADYSLDAQADRIAAVLDTLDITHATLIAHAVGGSVALRLAHARPDLAARILLIEGGAAESAVTPGFRRAMKLAPLIKLLGTGKVRGRVRDQMIAASGDPDWVVQSVVDGYTQDAAQDLGATLDAYSAMGDARERGALAPRLPELRAPVLLLLGGAPHASGPKHDEVERLLAALPAVTAETLEGVGHFPHEEAPTLVRDVFVRFLTATSSR